MKKAIDYYVKQQGELTALEGEIAGLEKQKYELTERVNLLIEGRSNAAESLHEIKGQFARGTVGFEAVSDAEDQVHKLDREVNTLRSMLVDIGEQSRIIQRQISTKITAVQGAQSAVWDAIAGSLRNRITLHPDMLRAYSASRLAPFPAGSIGRWLDGVLGDIGPMVEQYQRELAIKHGLIEKESDAA